MPAEKVTANQSLYNAAVRHQIHVLRFSEEQARAAARALNNAEQELLEQITGAMAKGLDTDRLEALLVSIKERRGQVYTDLSKQMEATLKEMAEAEASWETGALEGSAPIELLTASVPIETLHATVASPIAGIPLAGWMDNISSAEASALQQAVTQAVLQGQTIDDLVRRIRGTQANNFTDGILSTSTRNAQALARTAVNHVSNEARNCVWEANSDIIRAIRWTSTLDGRTSDLCKSRDGHLAPIGDSVLFPADQPLVPAGARPPGHFQCRSLMIAIMDGVALAGDRPFVKDARVRKDREKAFRAEAKERGVDISVIRKEWADANVGQVPAATTYQDWLKTQPASFQDEVLGAGKAELFRKGVPLERFVDKSGKTLTLAELKAEIAGDSLNVLQPAIGVKAKGLLMQGLTPGEVLTAIKAEFPGASTTAASIASYKSELNKAGLLDSNVMPSISQLAGNYDTPETLSYFEAQLAPGVKNALQGQWASVVDTLDGHPGAYAHYKPGVGVELSSKLSSLSAAQAQQIMAHELGHLLHKVHGLGDGYGPTAVFKGMTNALNAPGNEQLKKLYSYYLSSPDEAWAEVIGQALHDSPVTSQGIGAGPFKELMAPYIQAAKQAISDKFPDSIPPVMPTGPVISGIGEIAGKPTSIGGYAKALLQQGMSDEDVLNAVKAEFPNAKTGMNSIKSYKSELKKVELASIGGGGPGIKATTSAKIPTVKPLPLVPDKVEGFADPAAEIPAPTYDTIQLSGLTKTGGKPGGSNPGGLYNDATGTEWLVKGNLQKANGNVPADVSDARARNEVLAARLIRFSDAGLAPEMKLVELEGQYGGGLGVASKMLDKPVVAFDKNNSLHIAAAQKDFALHAWMGNYDVVGMGFDNLVMKGGKAVNIDPGGALLFRAQGLPKTDFGIEADTWNTMRTGTKNPAAKAVYGSMTDAQLKASAEKLMVFTDEVIDQMVEAMGPGGVPMSNNALATILKLRRDDILKNVGIKPMLGKGAVSVPEAPKIDIPAAPASNPLAVYGVTDEQAAQLKSKLSTTSEGGVNNTTPELSDAIEMNATWVEDELGLDIFTDIDADKLEELMAWTPAINGEVLGPKWHALSDFAKTDILEKQLLKMAPEKWLEPFTDDLGKTWPSKIDYANSDWIWLPEKLTLEKLKLIDQGAFGSGPAPSIPVAAPVVSPVPVAVNYKAMTTGELLDSLLSDIEEIKNWNSQAKKSMLMQKAAAQLFKAGLNTEKVQQVLIAKFGQQYVPKVTSLASMKSKLKKEGLLDGPPGVTTKSNPVAATLPEPKLWGKALGGKSAGVKEGAKNMIQQGSSAKEVVDWIGTQFSTPNIQGAQDLYELAHYEIMTGKLAAKPGVASYANNSYTPKPSYAAPVPLRPATTAWDNGPPPPRFTKEGWLAALHKYGGKDNLTDAKLNTINKHQKAAGLEELGPEEYAALKAYTNSAYRGVNEKLRGGKYTEDTYLQAWTDAAMHGMMKLPPWEGNVVRGMSIYGSELDMLKSFYTPGGIVREVQFTSTSDAAKGTGFGGNVRYHIRTKSGRDVRPISSHTGEQEILLAPGTQYRVLKREDNEQGGFTIHLEEV